MKPYKLGGHHNNQTTIWTEAVPDANRIGLWNLGISPAPQLPRVII